MGGTGGRDATWRTGARVLMVSDWYLVGGVMGASCKLCFLARLPGSIYPRILIVC